MNTKLLEPLPESLVISKYPFGSIVYGTAKPDSDTDYLVILKKSVGDMRLQYQGVIDGKKVDYVYTDLKQLIQDLDTGGSAAAFEVIHTQDLGIHPLDCYTYENAKMYLGLAKRDLDYPERLHHVRRCLAMAYSIMNKKLIDLSDTKWIELIDKRTPEELKECMTDMRQELNIMYKKV